MKTPFRFEQEQRGGVIVRRDFFHDGFGGHTIEHSEFRPNVGDVVVTDVSCDNPYTYAGPYRIGDERVKVLSLFRRAAQGHATAGDWLRAQQVQLWYAPAAGGALRITAECVDWATSGVREVLPWTRESSYSKSAPAT